MAAKVKDRQNVTAGSLPGVFIPTHISTNKDLVQVVTLALHSDTKEMHVVYRDKNYNVWIRDARTFKMLYGECDGKDG